MTIVQSIERLVRELDGAGICDVCVTDRLHLSMASQANAVTRPLGERHGYERLRDRCDSCGRVKLVTRRAVVVSQP